MIPEPTQFNFMHTILLNCLLHLKWPILVVSVQGKSTFFRFPPKKFDNIDYYRAIKRCKTKQVRSDRHSEDLLRQRISSKCRALFVKPIDVVVDVVVVAPSINAFTVQIRTGFVEILICQLEKISRAEQLHNSDDDDLLDPKIFNKIRFRHSLQMTNIRLTAAVVAVVATD